MEPLDQYEIARISNALGRAVHIATSLVDAEDFGDELRGLVRHARELHEILLREQRRSNDSWVADELRTVCHELGTSLDQIESLIDEARPPEASRA